jgi:hypothetical protein
MAEELDATAEGLGKYIIKRTKEVWDTSSVPYMLSWISPELQAKGILYKTIIGPQTLKQFAATLADHVRLVVHPTQKSRIGLVPKTENFEFEEELTLNTSLREATPKKLRQPSQRYIVTQFLVALSRLNDDELNKINIPISVLAKLLGEK